MKRVTIYQEFSSKSSYEISEEIVQYIKQQLSRYTGIELFTVSDEYITDALKKAKENKSDLFIALNIFQDNNDIIEKSNKGVIFLNQNNQFVVDFANVMNDTLEDNTKEYIYDYKDIIYTNNNYINDSMYIVINNIDDKDQDTFSIAMDIVDGLVSLYKLPTKKELKKNIKDNTKYHVLILGSTLPILTTTDKYIAISACNAYIGGKVVTSDGIVVHKSTSTKYIV